MNFYEIVSAMQELQIEKAFLIPCFLILVDFISGSLYAWSNKKFTSSKMRTGLTKKTGELFLLFLGSLLTFVGFPRYVLVFIIAWVSLMELISFCENLHKMGVELPTFITSGLQEAQKQAQEAPTSGGVDHE